MNCFASTKIQALLLLIIHWADLLAGRTDTMFFLFPGRKTQKAAFRSLWLPLLFSPDHSGVSWGGWQYFQGTEWCWVCVSVCWWGSECGNWELFSANLHRIHFVCTISWLVWHIFFALMAVSLLESDQDAYWMNSATYQPDNLGQILVPNNLKASIWSENNYTNLISYTRVIWLQVPDNHAWIC